MSKHHRDYQWAPLCDRHSWQTNIVDDHTHMLSVINFVRDLNKTLLEKGREPIEEPTVNSMLAQAQHSGVEQVIEVGCELPDLEPVVALANAYPQQVHAAIAIHPNESVLHGHRGVPGPDGLPICYRPHHDISFEDAMSRVYDLAVTNCDTVVAIGETGMDLYRTGEGAINAQKEAFRAHIALAKELNLPLQIHDRDAHREVVETLLSDGAPERTVFHSYSGGPELAQILKEHGWYASFSGTLGYKGNEGLRESAHIIGLDHITLETDAPYLTPMPYRGKPNAPYMVAYTLQTLADIIDMPLEDVARSTRDTTRTIYSC